MLIEVVTMFDFKCKNFYDKIKQHRTIQTNIQQNAII